MKRLTPLSLIFSLLLLACSLISPIPAQIPPISTNPDSTTLQIIPATETPPLCENKNCETTETPPPCAGDCPTQTAPQLVPFPPDSVAAKHAFYPLVGQQVNLECQACHTTEQYGGTPNTCTACHNSVTPANHYTGDCVACHTSDAWQSVVFDHQLVGATDCLSCHAVDAPVNHFAGQCVACHTTLAWLPATFDHTLAGASDCLACHTADAPVNHYMEQCSLCHSSTTTWTGASYPHVFSITHGGANGNCVSCHVGTTATWMCSVCHNDGEMLNEHNEEGINNISNCLQCHPTGQEGDGGGGDGDD